MRVDLHNHTTLCNHATGSMEEYVQKAIDENIEIFGFSEHAPMAFDEKYRMRSEQMEAYERKIDELARKYKNEIEILKGYEVDFLPQYLQSDVLKADVDYLIGSIHFLPKNGDLWGFDNPEFIGGYEGVDIDKLWEDYFAAIEAMAKSGHFQIVGHIDLLKVFNFKPKKDIRLLARNALKAIKRADMAIEINAAGLRKPVQEPYPGPELLEEIRELDIPITFASDAHAPQQVGQNMSKIETLVKETGFDKVAVFRQKEKELLKI